MNEKMNVTEHIAKHIQDVHHGGNWTSSNLKDAVADISWHQATMQVYGLNTIAALVYHIQYYISAVLNVLQGEPLDANDLYSFNHPPIRSQKDWDDLLDKTWSDAEKFASLIGQLPESKVWENFPGDKYGNYYRNLQGIVEHTHYHLGQIVVIKKIIMQMDKHGLRENSAMQ